MSTNKHIAVVGVTSTSHIYPSLSLVRELVARGHRVSYAVGDSKCDLIAPTGAAFVGYPSVLPDPQNDKAIVPAEAPKDAGEVMQIFLDEAMVALPHLIARFEQDPPDLVLYDAGAMVGPVLAHRYGVPAVQFLVMAMTILDEQDKAKHRELLDSLGSSESARRYYETCNAWLADNGIDRDANEWQSNPGPVLSLFPRAMQPNADQAPDTVRFVGPCFDPHRLTDRSWSPPDNGNRVLLVAFGNSFNNLLEVYRMCIDAFANSDWHLVLAVGDRVDVRELDPHPDNVEVRRSVPQLTVLESASAFVTHAGMGSCTEALWYAVPTVAIPQAIDQFGNAARLAELGAGTSLSVEEITSQTLRAAVEAVAADPDIAARLAAIQKELRDDAGVDVAANAVESFLVAH